MALRHGQRVGAATYRIDRHTCEVVTLDACVQRQGVGSELLDALIEAARTARRRRPWLITTNDNTGALRFYQRRALRLVAVQWGAVERARALKPEIPLVGDDGIPIHDEIELELRPD